MKKYNRFKLSGEITEESVWTVLDWMDFLDTEGIVYAKLYINSLGGDADAAAVLTEALNERPFIDIVALGNVSSAGFMIYTECSNHKSLSKYFRYGLIHKPDSEVSLSAVYHPRPKYPSRIVYEQYEQVCNLNRELIKELLTEEEFVNYDNGDDLSLDRDRMLEITKHLNIKNKECLKVRDTLREDQDKKIEELKESFNNSVNVNNV